jgi:hypothetical protein
MQKCLCSRIFAPLKYLTGTQRFEDKEVSSIGRSQFWILDPNQLIQ